MRYLHVFGLVGMAMAVEAHAQQDNAEMKATPIGSIASWFPDEEYPIDALRANRSGRVITRVGVDSTGQVVSCDVTTTSGTLSLDEKTCELLKSKGRFQPATDKAGNPTSSSQSLGVRWTVPSTSYVDVTKPISQTFDAELIVDANGSVESCKASGSNGQGDKLCHDYPAGSEYPMRFSENGVPVRVTLHNRTVWEVRPIETLK